jgi:hypothetical protein
VGRGGQRVDTSRAAAGFVESAAEDNGAAVFAGGLCFAVVKAVITVAGVGHAGPLLPDAGTPSSRSSNLGGVIEKKGPGHKKGNQSDVDLRIEKGREIMTQNVLCLRALVLSAAVTGA